MAKLNTKEIIDTINKGIAVNPTEITIKQVKKIIVNGAFKEVESEKNLKVLIYLENNSNEISIYSKTQGTSYSSNKYKMIADKDADININPKNAIEFDCIEGHMKIKATYPIVIEGTICGYQCDLERVS